MSQRIAEIPVIGGQRIFLTQFAAGSDQVPRRCLQLSLWGNSPVTEYVQLNRDQVARLERELAAWLAGEVDAA